MDCVFILFSEKYMLNDTYCKLVVHMAVHGIPFFVICTDSSESCSQESMDRIKRYFQGKDISGIRMLNPNKPGEVLKELITEFFKEVSWNRSAIDRERTADVSETILGQTVRLKDLEKKPELNGRCGVCVGYDKDQSRYHVRLITNGVESDIALKQHNFSILKPKMLYNMVRIKDLTSKPELNGRYGLVDAFLRETERYRVLVPDRPGSGHALSLKSANLDRVEETSAEPVKELPPPEPRRRSASAKPAPRPTCGPFVAGSTGGQTWKVIGGENKGGIIVKRAKELDSALETQRLSTSSLVEELQRDGDRISYRLLYGSGPRTGWVSLRVHDKELLVKSDAVVCGSRTVRAAPQCPSDAAEVGKPAATTSDVGQFDRPARPKPERSPVDEPASKQSDHAIDPPARSKAVLQPRPSSPPTPSCGATPASTGASSAPELAETLREEAPRGRFKLKKEGLFGMKVWAVVGSPEKAEDVMDHLMDCGKTVFCVSHDGGQVQSLSELGINPNLPRAEVLAFVDTHMNLEDSVAKTAELGLQGVLLHPSVDAFPSGVASRGRSADLEVFGADILEEVLPGSGLSIAPLD